MADYYELLGVPRDADANHIKKAYRKLAMEHHPDRNNGSPEAEERFKELSEAYETLKDPERRSLYDRFGKEGMKGAGGAGPFQGFDLHDAIEIFMRDFGGGGFEEIFGGARRTQRGPRIRKGETVRIRLPLTLEDVVNGGTKRIRVALLESCQSCSGTGSKEGAAPAPCEQCEGTGEERIAQRSVLGQFVSVTTCRACGGEGQRLVNPCSDCLGEGRRREEVEVDVEVPTGVTSENFITLRGKGNAGPRGGPRGDIMVMLEVEEDPEFIRDGNHLITDVVITFAHAALGGEVEVPCVGGRVPLEIPAGTQSGQGIRIRGKGIPDLNGRGRGDLIARVRVWTPTRLGHEEAALLRKLREVESSPPERVEEGEGGRRGFWSRVKEAFTS